MKDTVGKEKQMATFTFDRPIVIKDEEPKRKLEDVLYSDRHGRKLPSRAFSKAERKKGEELLARRYFTPIADKW